MMIMSILFLLSMADCVSDYSSLYLSLSSTVQRGEVANTASSEKTWVVEGPVSEQYYRTRKLLYEGLQMV